MGDITQHLYPQGPIERAVSPRTGKTYALGRRRPTRRPRLRLANYTRYPPRDVSPPDKVSYGPLATSSLHQVYLNDQLGDCVIAGGYHVLGTWRLNSGQDYAPTSSQITGDYSAIGGYVPGRPWTDQGCDEVTALDYWSRVGFATGDRLAGYLAVDATDKQELMTAIYLFENLFHGVELPREWLNQDMPQGDGFVWGVAGNPVPWNGHCIMSYGYDSVGAYTDTWGMVGTVTWGALAQYMVPSAGGECYALISRAALDRATERAPNGIDWDTLVKDFDALGGSVS